MRFPLAYCAVLICLGLQACSEPAPLPTATPTSAPTSLPADPTATRPVVPANPSNTPASTATPLPQATSVPETSLPAPTTVVGESHSYGRIGINGDPAFVEQTKLALALLESKAPEAYQKIQTYVGLIEQSERSGMWAYEQPPRYAVGDRTAFFSVTWYASTIAHDATHSELYHQYLQENPGAPVPEDAWTGEESERFCNSYQLAVLKLIEGPAEEIEYLAGLTGTHCDVNGDGDCDWDDYNARDW